jgi:hypothetical protein
MSIDINYKLEELKVAELSVHQLIAEDPNLNHGIYVFKNQSDGIYVGRSTSGSFVEGISAHFDKKNNAWMNTILKKLSNSKGILIQEAYSYFLQAKEKKQYVRKHFFTLSYNRYDKRCESKTKDAPCGVPAYGINGLCSEYRSTIS